jgi:hypothetical protein
MNNRVEAICFLVVGIIPFYLGRLGAFKKYQARKSRLDVWLDKREFLADILRTYRMTISRKPLRSKFLGIVSMTMGSLIILMGIVGLILPSAA